LWHDERTVGGNDPKVVLVKTDGELLGSSGIDEMHHVPGRVVMEGQNVKE